MSRPGGEAGDGSAPGGPGPRLIAHRGASAHRAEHTRSAYRLALEQGADGLECDVRLTRDGVAVCWHDLTVDRTSDGHGPVHEHTLDRLRRLDVVSWTGHAGEPARGSEPEVLTLAELVDLARGADRPVTLAVELKHPAPDGYAAEDAVLAVLDRAGWDARAATIDRVVLTFMSFHPGSLEHLARRVPAEHLMILLDGHDGEDGPDLAASRLADEGLVGGVGPSIDLVRAEPDRVRRWVAAGRLVRVWTVNDPVDVDLCSSVGVQEVTTDDPAGVRAHLTGAWPPG